MKIKNCLLIITFATVFMYSCIDPPEDFVAPIWNVDFNAPLTSRSYTLEEAIESDTSITWITDSNNPDNIGLLVFSDRNDLERITIEDNLTVDDFSSQTSEVIGSVKIDDVDPFQTFISVQEWVNIPPGTSSAFPENRSNLISEFSEIDEFVSVTFKNGNLNLNFVNKLPVEIQFEEIQIRRTSNNALVLEVTENLPLIVPAESQNATQIDLSETTFYNDLLVDLVVFSEGSNGEVVTIENDAGFDVVSTLSDLEISRTTAVLPEQDPFVEVSTAKIDDSTFVETATFKQGSFEIVFDNFIDLAIDIDLKIENLVDPSGNAFLRNINLARKEANKIISISNLENWKIQTKTPGTPTNEIGYEATVAPRNSDDPRELSEEDSISISVNFNNMSFSSIEGRFKPTSFDIDETNFDFDFGNFNDRFTMEQMVFAQPNIILNLTSTALVDIDLNAELIGSNDTQSESLLLNNLRINRDDQTRIDLNDFGLTNFLNSFSGSLPNNFLIRGEATANPNYAPGSAKSEDFVEGFTEVEIPLFIGITGGSIKDTVDIDLGELDENDLDNVNQAELTIELTNGIASTARMTAFVLDENGVRTLNIPTETNQKDFIEVAAPSVDTNGNVISDATNTEILSLTGDDIKKIINGSKLGVEIELETPPSSSTNPVKFKNTDKISFRVSVSGNYNTDFDNEE